MRAARFQEFAVHVGDAARAGALVQIVDVLGDERQLVAALGHRCFQPGEREMGGVGLRIEDVPATEIIEGVNLLRVFGEGFGGRQLHRVEPRPEAPLVAEGAEFRSRPKCPRP